MVTESSEAGAFDLKIKQIVPLAASQFPRWVPAESGFLVEELPAELQGAIHGRHLSHIDLNIEVTATLVESGRILKAKLAPESSGTLGGAIDGHAWLP